MNAPNTILYIESGNTGGGSFESLYQFLRIIKKDRYRAVILFLNQHPFVDLFKTLGFPVYVAGDLMYASTCPRYIRCIVGRMERIIERFIPFLYLPFIYVLHRRTIKMICSIIDREQVQLVHLNNQIQRDLYALYAVKKKSVKCISHLRSMRGYCFSGNRAHFANTFVQRFIANSKATKKYWVSLGVNGEKVSVVYNALGQAHTEELFLRKQWGMPEDNVFVIGCVANFSSAKGHFFLVRAFSKIAEHYPDARLVLVGDGVGMETIRRAVQTFAITEKVHFAGYYAHARSLMSNFDVIVVPSETESFGRVLIEGLDRGVPVIATRVGGIPEIIQHEENGLLVAYDNDEELFEAVSRVKKDVALRQYLVECGKESVRLFSSIEDYAEQLYTIYDEVLS